MARYYNSSYNCFTHRVLAVDKHKYQYAANHLFSYFYLFKFLDISNYKNAFLNSPTKWVKNQKNLRKKTVSYWLNKSFLNCSFEKCISALKQAANSLKLPEARTNARNTCFKALKIARSINNAINFALISDFHIACPNLASLQIS